MKIGNLKLLLLLGLICTSLFSNEDLSIDSLLNNIEKKTDLSEKTKIENSGITFIFTRDDIQRILVDVDSNKQFETYPNEIKQILHVKNHHSRTLFW